ncbi:MAG: hypothetical protein WAL09_09115, partial [Pseudolabrys sp.]
LDRAEGMLDRLTPLTHLLRMLIKPALHSLDNMLMLPFSLITKVRLSRVVNPMTPALAQQARIKEDERWRYFRLDSGKRNIAPPTKATWYRLGRPRPRRGPQSRRRRRGRQEAGQRNF